MFNCGICLESSRESLESRITSFMNNLKFVKFLYAYIHVIFVAQYGNRNLWNQAKDSKSVLISSVSDPSPTDLLS